MSAQSKTAAVTLQSFRPDFVVVHSARSPLQSWQAGCCGTPLRMTGWLIWRLCVEARYRARREVQRRLTDGLSVEQRQRLDALTQRRAEASQSWLAWLRQMPEAGKLVAMLGLVERLEHVRVSRCCLE